MCSLRRRNMSSHGADLIAQADIERQRANHMRRCRYAAKSDAEKKKRQDIRRCRSRERYPLVKDRLLEQKRRRYKVAKESGFLASEYEKHREHKNAQRRKHHADRHRAINERRRRQYAELPSSVKEKLQAGKRGQAAKMRYADNRDKIRGRKRRTWRANRQAAQNSQSSSSSNAPGEGDPAAMSG